MLVKNSFYSIRRETISLQRRTMDTREIRVILFLSSLNFVISCK